MSSLDKTTDAIAESGEPETVSGFSHRSVEDERGANVLIENRDVRLVWSSDRLRGQPGEIDTGVDVLGALNLIFANNGSSFASGGFPINVAEVVAGHVFPKLLEFPTPAVARHDALSP